MSKKPKTKASKKAKPQSAEPDNTECCGNCHHWREQLCKRYPPTNGAPVAVHQTATSATDWCGDWRKKAA